MMDRILEGLRVQMLATFSAFRPSLSLTFVAAQLCYDTLDEVRSVRAYSCSRGQYIICVIL